METHSLYQIVLVIVLGIGAQWLAWTAKIPSILLLLVLGFVAGPVTGIIPPESLQGEWLFAFVSLAIGVILFEGGLSLQISELREVGRSVLNLITVGVVITGALAGFFAWFVIGMAPEVAILTGGILTVTGPTVVQPLLRHVRPKGRVSTIAKWEGITIDPVGALVAVLLLDLILAFSTGAETASGNGGLAHYIATAAESLLTVLVIGIGVSILGAALQIVIIRRHLVPDYLQDSVALTLVLAVFAAADAMGGEETALMATTLMGIFLANQPWVSVRRIVKFKEDLQALLLAALFILLSARLDVGVLEFINARAFLFLAILILLVRPVAVFLSCMRTGLHWKERAFMSWLAPRGIVAAAVAALFAERLVHNGFPQEAGDALIATVYLVVVGTVAVYGLTLSPIALKLGLADRNPQGVLFLGAYKWVREAALALQELGFRVLLIDANARNIGEAQRMHLPAVVGDALSESDTDELDLSGLKRFLAVTANDEINTLAALHFTEVFEEKEVYQLGFPTGPQAEGSRRTDDLRGRPLFGGTWTQAQLMERSLGGGEVRTFGLNEAGSYQAIKAQYGGDIILLFVARGANVLVHSEASQVVPQVGDSVVVMLPPPTDMEDESIDLFEEEIWRQATVLDVEGESEVDGLLDVAAKALGERLDVSHDLLRSALKLRLGQPSAVAARGVVVEHIVAESAKDGALILLRSKRGLAITRGGQSRSEPVHAFIIMVTPAESDEQASLPLLAQLTGIVQKKDFRGAWLDAESLDEMRDALTLHREQE